MKILGIVGSKRKKGNTSVLVNRALEKAKEAGAETELIFLGDYAIKGCSGCEGCKKTRRCVIDDDMQKLYPLLLEADGVILGSPTYYYNVSSDVKAFLDRCYCFEVFAEDDRSIWLSLNEALGIKYASVIAVCEQHSEEDMGPTAEVMAKSLEALGYRVVDKVKAFGLFAQGAALKDERSLEKADRAGERLVKTLKLGNEVREKWGT
jgi:multimeric flavodoxin WrbA